MLKETEGGGLFANTSLNLLYVQLRICYTGPAVFFLDCLCSVAANLTSSLQIESPSFHPGLQFHQLLSAAALGLHSSFKHMQEKFKISVVTDCLLQSKWKVTAEIMK